MGQISSLEGVEQDSETKSGELSSGIACAAFEACGLLTSIGRFDVHIWEIQPGSN